MAKAQERKQLGRIFAAICQTRFKNRHGLLHLYQIPENDDDNAALEKICQIVTDIGYFGAAVSGLLGAAEPTETKSHLMLSDIGSPVPGSLKKGRFATHTWDIIIPDGIKGGVSDWRRSTLGCCYLGDLRYDTWRQNSQSGLLVQNSGVTSLHHAALSASGAQKLLNLAEHEGGERGFDLLWENVVRFFLKTGNPRSSQAAAEILSECSR